MMKNKIIYSFRNIKHNKLNAIITTVGLSIALASVLIIFLFVQQENSYNSFHDNADRIYRFNYKIVLKDGTNATDHLIKPNLADELSDKIPQIEYCTPFRVGYMAQLELENMNMNIKLGIAEQEFFNMFTFNLLHGNKNELLTNPTNIVLTKSFAEKLLADGSGNVEKLVGQSLKFTFIQNTAFTVSGILDDIPKNSTIDFEAIIPFKYEDAFWQSNNELGNSSLFIELKKDADPEEANVLIAEKVKDFYKDVIEKAQKYNYLIDNQDCFQPFMLPLKKLYLDNSVVANYETTGNKTQLNILTAVSILILIIAFSNYIILTNGQFFKKAGEISIRKSLGGKNSDILKMFLNENSILISASFLLGGLLSYLFIPLFNNITQSQIYFNLINIPTLLVFLISSIILLILLTSVIPAITFRKIKPTILATKSLYAGKKTGAPQIFVGLQYALTIALIIATIVISKQTFYLKNKSLGFSDENIISVDVRYLDQSKSAILRDILQKQTGVINTSLTNRNYFDGYSTRSFEVSSSEAMETYMFKADNYFIPTMELKLIDGRNFNESEINTTNKSIIVNEKFVLRMGYDSSPVGKTVKGGYDFFQIIGVVNDYQFRTSREKIEPMVLYSNTQIGNNYSSVLIKYNPQNLDNVISAIKRGWKEMDTKETLNYIFWDKELESRYKSEERLSKMITYASIIAIVILSLGLFGLTVLISAQRTNEIGIRKVNGAKIIEVIVMLNRNFIKWVIIAFIIATPVAYYIMYNWLENFASQTELNWWIFALAGFIALMIALLTVSWQSWKAATKNPVESLRYE